MRRQLTGVLLVSMLMLSALATCLGAVRWFFAVEELQRLQARADAMTRTSTVMQQLVADAIDYGRRNPDIQPVLTRLNQKAAGFNPTNAPQRTADPGLLETR